MTPKVSVGVPVYNGERYLPSALASLAAQDAGDFEVVICDNASTDGTGAICEAYASADRRFRYHRNPSNIGSAPNFNRSFELSRGEYFKWAAHDDECLPSMLSACSRALDEAGPDAVMAYPRSDLIDSSGAVIQPSPDEIDSDAGRPFVRLGRVLMRVSTGHPFYGVMRRSALEKTKLLQSVISGDYIMLGELAMLGRIIEVPEVLFRYRMHPESTRAKYSLRDLAVWFDPSNKSKREWLPEVVALQRDHLLSVRRPPLSLAERALCAATVPSVITYRRTRNFLGRRKAEIRALLGMAPSVGKEQKR